MRRTSLSLVATGLVAAVLPLGIPTGAQAEPEPAFSGYVADGWAAPVKVEFYEPTIPIPAEPQFELDLAYTMVRTDTGLHRGRASWLWPGDPVGEGAKTFVEQLGLPKELGENGYPVQVNSNHPSGPAQQADEPFPGMVMRTQADAESAVAQAGFSPDGDVSKPDDSEGGEGGEGGSPAPGIPGLPGLPELPGSGGASGADQAVDQLAAVLGGRQAAAEEEPAPGGAPGLPPELAALVDISGYTSTSAVTIGSDAVRTASSSALGQVSLLAGIVTMEGITARSTTTSDGEASAAKGKSSVGSITIAGTTFGFGSDGIEAGGQDTPIPALPDDPEKALAQLGITLVQPDRRLEAKGLVASGLAEALRVEIDTRVLRSKLDALPLREVIGAVPDQAGELKNLLSAAAGLAPRIVITLGNAGARTETVKGIDIALPEIPAAGATDGASGASGAGSSAGGAAGTAGGAATSAPGAPTDSAAASDSGAELPADAALAAGLPALTTIPGALMMGGILLAIGAGTWLRRIGVLALGGASTCAQGLDSGLPDLRKA